MNQSGFLPIQIQTLPPNMHKWENALYPKQPPLENHGAPTPNDLSSKHFVSRIGWKNLWPIQLLGQG